MTTPTEKAAPIPAEVRERALEIGFIWFGAGHHDAVALASDIERLVAEALADRASQEERIREDERVECPDCGSDLDLQGDTDDQGDWWTASCNTPRCPSRSLSRHVSRSKADAYEKFFADRARLRGDAS